MATFSPRVDELLLTTKASTRSGRAPNNVVVHGWAGMNWADAVGRLVYSADKASANYIIQDDRLAGSVPEELRAWTSGSDLYDSQAITVENANSTGAPSWQFSDSTFEELAQLIADVARRYGKTAVRHGWQPQGSTTIGVIGHRDVPGQATACPQSMWQRLDELASRADTILRGHLEPPPAAPLAGATHKVLAGESLWSIARKLLGDPNRWPEIQAANGIRNPNLLRVGQELIIPGATTAKPVTVGLTWGGKAVFTGTRDYTGRLLNRSVIGGTFDVIEIRGDRVVIGHGKAVTAAVHAHDLKPV